jgi:thiamine monophosphate kinase
MPIALGPGREFASIARWVRQWGARAHGIGDDAAILDVPTGTRLVVSTDTTTEDVHFRRAWLAPIEIGWRAAMAALSDLAAMGAEPLGVLIALGAPASWDGALDEVLHELALMVARDGEGAQKLITIDVTGAVSAKSAHRIAMAIANSPLVKTAIAGEDANWGRIVMAVGKAGEPADRDKLSIAVGGVWMAREGGVIEGYDEAPVVAHMKGREVQITVDIGLGRGKARVWTCDLTHGYIDINGSYRS